MTPLLNAWLYTGMDQMNHSSMELRSLHRKGIYIIPRFSYSFYQWNSFTGIRYVNEQFQILWWHFPFFFVHLWKKNCLIISAWLSYNCDDTRPSEQIKAVGYKPWCSFMRCLTSSVFPAASWLAMVVELIHPEIKTLSKISFLKWKKNYVMCILCK